MKTWLIVQTDGYPGFQKYYVIHRSVFDITANRDQVSIINSLDDMNEAFETSARLNEINGIQSI